MFDTCAASDSCALLDRKAQFPVISTRLKFRPVKRLRGTVSNAHRRKLLIDIPSKIRRDTHPRSTKLHPIRTSLDRKFPVAISRCGRGHTRGDYAVDIFCALSDRTDR